MDLGTLFPGVQNVPGVGFVNTGTLPYSGANPKTGLGDDAAVMMISGLGADDAHGTTKSNIDAAGNPIAQALYQLPDVGALLRAKVRVGAYEVPVWVLLLAALGGMGLAGWYFWGKKK